MRSIRLHRISRTPTRLSNSIVRHILITLFKNPNSLITTDRVMTREWVRWPTSVEGCWLWVTLLVDYFKFKDIKQIISLKISSK